MTLRTTVRLELDDHTDVLVTYDGRDLRAWEAAHDSSALRTPLSVGMLTWLGWHAAVRQGMVNGPLSAYEAFDAVCTSVGVERDPTQPRSKRSKKAPGGG